MAHLPFSNRFVGRLSLGPDRKQFTQIAAARAIQPGEYQLAENTLNTKRARTFPSLPAFVSGCTRLLASVSLSRFLRLLTIPVSVAFEESLPIGLAMRVTE